MPRKLAWREQGDRILTLICIIVALRHSYQHMNQEQLLNFVVAVHKHGYASGQAAPSQKEPDGSTTIEYASGDWKHHDTFFGGEPYAGREVVFYQGKAVWMMVY